MPTDYPNTTEFMKSLFTQGANIMDLQSKQGTELLDAMSADLERIAAEDPEHMSPRKEVQIKHAIDYLEQTIVDLEFVSYRMPDQIRRALARVRAATAPLARDCPACGKELATCIMGDKHSAADLKNVDRELSRFDLDSYSPSHDRSQTIHYITREMTCDCGEDLFETYNLTNIEGV